MQIWEGMALTVMNVTSNIIRNQDLYIREHETDAYRPRCTQSESKKIALEEEIRELRSQMEHAAVSERSFTSEVVIRISMMMDEKINEYNAFIMKMKKK